jgi:hypothetical protein
MPRPFQLHRRDIDLPVFCLTKANPLAHDVAPGGAVALIGVARRISPGQES